MSQQFDELAKSLASGMSRREALRRFAGGVAGTLLATLGIRDASAQQRYNNGKDGGSGTGNGGAQIQSNGGVAQANLCINYCVQSLSCPSSVQENCVVLCRLCIRGGGTFHGIASTGNQACGGFSCTGGNPPPSCATVLCPVGLFCCNGTCRNLQTDPMNCGSCNNVCGTNQICCGGVCRNYLTDPNNCGFCGNVCTGGTTCINGGCVGGVQVCNPPCPAGATCNAQGVCVCPPGQALCGRTAQVSGVCCGVGQFCRDNATCVACIRDEHCPPARVCVNNVCVCAPGRLECDGGCVDARTDPNHCGACGNRCPAGTTCVGGVCTCPDNRPVCGPNKVCCPQGQTCVNGVCQGQVGGACLTDANCPPGSRCCNGICRNIANDPNNCGACGHQCPPGFFCHNGCCICCPPGYIFCNGCCINGQTDENNCGACGVRCPAGAVCINGHCVCPPGRVLCGHTATNPGVCCLVGQTCVNGVCQGQVGGACLTNQDCPPGALCCNGICRNVSNDNQNCGVCGNVCQGGTVCVNCCCVCPPGTHLCGNLCINTQTDPNNCGACGRQCPVDAVCVNGVCVCPQGRVLCGHTANTRGVCCLPGQTCPNGVCLGQVGGACLTNQDCPPGALCCNNICRNIATDPANCGACGRVCPPGWFCHQGCCVCNQVGGTCPPGTHLCGGFCVNLSNDARNCGACGRYCPGNSVCYNGNCYCPHGTTWSSYWQKCV